MANPPENQASIDVRKGMPLADVAWDAYSNSRKSPLTRNAGIGFADPDYDLAADWLAASDGTRQAEAQRDRGAARW